MKRKWFLIAVAVVLATAAIQAAPMILYRVRLTARQPLKVGPEVMVMATYTDTGNGATVYVLYRSGDFEHGNQGVVQVVGMTAIPAPQPAAVAAPPDVQ